MAGLPCEVCQEAMMVITIGSSANTLITDATGRTVFRRYRVCTTPDCEFYLVRRETFEVVAPLGRRVRIMHPWASNLRKLDLSPRTSPPPTTTPSDKESR